MKTNKQKKKPLFQKLPTFSAELSIQVLISEQKLNEGIGFVSELMGSTTLSKEEYFVIRYFPTLREIFESKQILPLPKKLEILR